MQEVHFQLLTALDGCETDLIIKYSTWLKFVFLSLLADLWQFHHHFIPFPAPNRILEKIEKGLLIKAQDNPDYD